MGSKRQEKSDRYSPSHPLFQLVLVLPWSLSGKAQCFKQMHSPRDLLYGTWKVGAGPGTHLFKCFASLPLLSPSPQRTCTTQLNINSLILSKAFNPCFAFPEKSAYSHGPPVGCDVDFMWSFGNAGLRCFQHRQCCSVQCRWNCGAGVPDSSTGSHPCERWDP